LRLTAINIGVLSGIPFTTDPTLVPEFQAGLSMGGYLDTFPNPQENCGYNAAKYQAGMVALNGHGYPLNIAVGGVKAEQGALSYATVDFISLVGAPGAGANPHHKARFSLESASSDAQRRAHLQNPPFSYRHSEIWLFANANSGLTPKESGFAGTQTVDIDETTSDATAQTSFTNALNLIPNTVMALMISADPWFMQKRSILVPLLTIWTTAGKHVTYPFQEYGAQPVKAGQTTLQGPWLSDGYKALGQLAAHVLNPAVVPLPPPVQQQIVEK
jgi:hypothetical protein